MSDTDSLESSAERVVRGLYGYPSREDSPVEDQPSTPIVADDEDDVPLTPSTADRGDRGERRIVGRAKSRSEVEEDLEHAERRKLEPLAARIAGRSNRSSSVSHAPSMSKSRTPVMSAQKPPKKSIEGRRRSSTIAGADANSSTESVTVRGGVSVAERGRRAGLVRAMSKPTFGALRDKVEELRSDMDLIGRCFRCGKVGRVHRASCCQGQRHLECEMRWQQEHRERWALAVDSEEVRESLRWGTGRIMVADSTVTFRRVPPLEDDGAFSAFLAVHGEHLYRALPCSLCGRHWVVVPAQGIFAPIPPSELSAAEKKVLQESAPTVVSRCEAMLGALMQDDFGCVDLSQVGTFMAKTVVGGCLPLTVLVLIISTFCYAPLFREPGAYLTIIFVCPFVALGLALFWRRRTVKALEAGLEEAEFTAEDEEEGITTIDDALPDTEAHHRLAMFHLLQQSTPALPKKQPPPTKKDTASAPFIENPLLNASSRV